MPDFEIVVSDPDLKAMKVFWVDQDSAFLVQTERDGKEQNIMLNVEEAKQTIAALAAFVAGRLTHTSDCALHNSPAYPIEPCTCDGHG